MNKEALVSALTRHRGLCHAGFAVYNYLPFNNRLSKGVKYGLSYLRGCTIRSFGEDNEIILGDFSRMIGCTVTIHGSHNRIVLEDFVYCANTSFCIEDDGSEIRVGTHCMLCGPVELAAIEGTKITLGRDCMLSGHIAMRTGDSHSIVKKGTRTRVNPSRSITIGNHVWVGTHATVLKGARIADSCIVGAGSLVTKAFDTPNCTLAGVPAQVVKQDIDWIQERI